MCEVIVTRNTSAGISLLSGAAAGRQPGREPGAGLRCPGLAAERPSWARPADSLSGPLRGRPVLETGNAAGGQGMLHGAICGAVRGHQLLDSARRPSSIHRQPGKDQVGGEGRMRLGFRAVFAMGQ